MTMGKHEKYSSVKHKLKFVSTVLSWVLFIILIFVAVVLLYYYVTTRVYSKKNPSYRPAFGLYTIVSPSMEKTLLVYDVIVNVRVNDPNDIKVGDIITFISSSASSQGMTITHRVISIDEDENGNKLYQTKGDNNNGPDPRPASYENVIGKVIFKIPQLGRLQAILTTKGGWLIIVVIPAFLIILSDILKLLRLQGAQKEIQNVQRIDDEKVNREIENKKEIEERLNRRYRSHRNVNERDPLRKSSVIVEVNGNDIDDDFDDYDDDRFDVPYELPRKKRCRKRKRNKKN